jgi:hypothetical protein
MSIVDVDKVAGIGKSRTENKLALLLTDHLEWDYTAFTRRRKRLTVIFLR